MFHEFPDLIAWDGGRIVIPGPAHALGAVLHKFFRARPAPNVSPAPVSDDSSECPRRTPRRRRDSPRERRPLRLSTDSPRRSRGGSPREKTPPWNLHLGSRGVAAALPPEKTAAERRAQKKPSAKRDARNAGTGKFTSFQRQLNNFGFHKRVAESGPRTRVYARNDMDGRPAEALLALRRKPGAAFATWDPPADGELGPTPPRDRARTPPAGDRPAAAPETKQDAPPAVTPEPASPPNERAVAPLAAPLPVLAAATATPLLVAAAETAQAFSMLDASLDLVDPMECELRADPPDDALAAGLMDAAAAAFDPDGLASHPSYDDLFQCVDGASRDAAFLPIDTF